MATAPQPAPRNLPLALAILRVTLGVFLLLWAIEKFVVPQATVSIWQSFYLMSIGESLPYVIGGVEALLAIAIIVGAWRTWTYGAGLVLHAISTLSTWKQLIDPWGLYLNDRVQHLFLAGVPVLAAFVALFLLRDYDEWTVEGKGRET